MSCCEIVFTSRRSIEKSLFTPQLICSELIWKHPSLISCLLEIKSQTNSSENNLSFGPLEIDVRAKSNEEKFAFALAVELHFN